VKVANVIFILKVSCLEISGVAQRLRYMRCALISPEILKPNGVIVFINSCSRRILTIEADEYDK